MNERTSFDRLVSDWLVADVPERAPAHILPAALARVADARQDRYLSQRLLGDRLGRAPRVRWALVLAVLGLALVGAAVAAGALLPRAPLLHGGPPSNGWIAFAANGQAGPRLEGTIVEPRNGDKDIYLVGSDGTSRRVIGTQDDGINQTCPMFSSDGTRLVYRELDLRTVTPTPPPVPSGASEAPRPTPQPQAAGLPRWTFVVTSIGADGAPIGDPNRIILPADQDAQVISCPIWSPDGERLAYTTDPAKDLWIVKTLDRQFTRIPQAPAAFNSSPLIAWSPDSRTIAYSYVDRIWLFPIDGGTGTSIVTGEVESVAWSPDGARLLVFRDSALRVFARDGTELFTIPAPDPRQAAGFWSPDGRWIAHVGGGRLELVSSDGTTTRQLDVDATALIGREVDGIGISIVSWSPDGKRLLVGLGQPLGATALVSVPIDQHEPTVVLVPLTLAVTGGGVTWQPVNP